VTLRSTRAARMYEPGAWVSRVSPTPLLMVVASNDKVTVADLALAAYERALAPKRLALIPGAHFDPYLDEFRVAEAAATEWFREHLIHPVTSRSERRCFRLINLDLTISAIGRGADDDCTGDNEYRSSLGRAYREASWPHPRSAARQGRTEVGGEFLDARPG
jgi:hypothetical protein